ncbi:hypothetical protein FCV43_10235 [Vibrio genomosp. F6]|uniref:hypothetical protein n=1 Tax=Vibrio genomosp. F6 TaxID=723172 RepID=UPI0010BD8745|nr:hypothetical protein [Vibrio genomosp. F6]TKF21697.1 hypothetical protein FCV43_10235 [Vibrio genomosp. F6]
MTMLKKMFIASMLTVAYAPSIYAGCDFFSNESVMLESKSSWCDSIANGVDMISSKVSTLGGLLEEEKMPNTYWAEWALRPEDEPILTQNISSNYIGLGIWMPDELAENENQMTTEEWLTNHGLQISIGLGEKKSGEPRMRFDYRWHEVYQGDVMMQIELPF